MSAFWLWLSSWPSSRSRGVIVVAQSLCSCLFPWSMSAQLQCPKPDKRMERRANLLKTCLTSNRKCLNLLQHNVTTQPTPSIPMPSRCHLPPQLPKFSIILTGVGHLLCWPLPLGVRAVVFICPASTSFTLIWLARCSMCISRFLLFRFSLFFFLLCVLMALVTSWHLLPQWTLLLIALMASRLSLLWSTYFHEPYLFALAGIWFSTKNLIVI